MWSKTRKALNNRLADSLKTRVNYNFMVYATTPLRRNTEMPVFYIHVDKKTWFASNPMFYCYCSESVNEQILDELYGDDWRRKSKVRDLYIIKETGLVDIYEVMPRIHVYLNKIGIQEAINGEDYFYRMLAIMDRRLGKRSIKKLLDHIDQEPVWFRKFIYLRASAEGMMPAVDSLTLLKMEKDGN